MGKVKKFTGLFNSMTKQQRARALDAIFASDYVDIYVENTDDPYYSKYGHYDWTDDKDNDGVILHLHV